jgi:membrane-associated phospholipid phosphatase
MTQRVLVASLILVLAGPARADEPADPTSIPGHTIDRRVNGGISGLATGIGLVSQLIPIRSHDLWTHELVSGEESQHDNFSLRAAHLADAMLGVSVAAPAFYLLGNTIDDADGDKLLIYGQSLAINAMIAGVTKRLVQRPRPYAYSKDPMVRKYIQEEGDDAFMSFYSGHSALGFGAATTGAYLLAASGASPSARAFAWGGGFMVAAATANLRVRAGKHFYSDVLIGSAIGISVGYIVPAVHADSTPYKPSGLDFAAGAAGILGGMMLSSLIPLEKRTSELDRRPPGLVRDLHLTPMAVSGGMGFAIGGGI